MKLSDFNITDRLHNRWCRFIIQRYLGQFLEQNLTLDQLSIELYAGKLTINDVKINAHYVNELLTSMNVPLRLTDGFVGGITIEVPWFSLASEASKMKVHQLELTFQSREGVKLDNKDLVSSMIGSVVESLVSSSDLARSFYENEKQAGEEEFDTDAEDGVKAFATVIDAIVSRFCMELTETTIRFENPPKSMSDLCTAVEIRLKEVRFMDEQMRNCQQEGRSAETITSQPQGMGSIANLNKFIDMSGVEIFTDVFTEIEDQYSDPNSSQIITINAGETNQTIGEQFRVAKVDNDRELKSNPVKFAEFVGESRMIFRIKNSDAVADKKDNRVEIESFFTGLHCFVLPSQIDILKRFFSSIALPQTEKLNDFGKKMDKSDYDAMAKNIEEETFQRTRMTTLGMQGTWSRREDFHEFDSINLEDNRTSRKMSEACRDNYKTISSVGKYQKESTILSAKIGMVLIYIPHNDIMSVEYTKSLNNGYFEAVDLAIEESNAFFAKATKVSVKHSNLHTTRNILDKLYFKDHLRLVGSSVVFHYQMDKNGSGEHMKAKLIFPSVDIIEYLTPESNPRDPENTHIPLLDFSKFENPDQEPQLKFEFSTSSTMVDESKTFIYIGRCRCELDLSIVDRIADLFEPRPFFDLPSYKRSRKDPLQLREDLFSMPLVEQSNKLMVVVKCQALELDLRVPMADLRNPGVARLPYRQRHVHPEYIGLHISSVTVEVPLGGESTVFELFATEIYGSFCGISDKFTCSDEDRRFLWGGQTSVDEPVHHEQIQFVSFPDLPYLPTLLFSMKFEYDPRNKALKASSTKIHCVAGLGINDDMAKSISLSVIQSLPRREGPFAQTHRSFLHNHEEGNDLILAGSREEMTSFGAKCILQSIMVNDLLLWQPAAPAVRPGEEEFKINALSDDMFHECGGDPMDRFDDECEEERFNTSVQSNGYDKNKSHVLSLLLNVKKGTMVMCTALKEDDEEKGVGQVSVELADAQLFAVGGYHGRMTDTYFYFTTHTIGVGHRNVCTMPKVVNQPDFGKWSRDDTQMDSIPSGDEFSTQSSDDAVGVAIFLCERPGQNIKDVLLAIAVRNTSLQVRPFSNLKETWAFQLADLFTLQDYPIPGYELPVVTTDLHIHLDNVVLAYDHVWTNPESDLRLRLVLGESDISSSIIQDMNMAKVTSIFESAQVFMSNAKKSKDNVRFEEQRSSKNVTATAPSKRKFFKVVDAWACADSLVALLNIVSEIAKSEKYSALPVKKASSARQSTDSFESATESEQDTPTSSTTQSAVAIPKPVEMKMKRMLASAMQERTISSGSSGAIPCGRDALEEFSPNFSTSQAKADLLADALGEMSHSDRNRAYSLSTDDEFCMVDEDVIGSGITNSAGEPNIKYIGSQANRSTWNNGVNIDPHYFRVPSDWRGDGLAALPADFPSPLISTSEYREGKGKNQVVSSDAFGGKHRDHSVCVVLELNKITCVYQLFGKDAPLMSMKLFTIHNITLLDKLTASQIKEMMYQYSSAEQPRRTCAPMLAVRMVESHKCEGKMRVSMLPIKFNIDQDTMEFLDDFFQEVRTSVDLPSEGDGVRVSDDLSYLEHRSRTDSPVKRPLADAPLTASAVSIGDLFGTKSRASQRVSPVEEVSPQSSSPDLVRAELPIEEDTLAIDDLHLAGDWSTSSEIRLSEDVNDFSRFPDLDPPATDSSVDRMLKSASMHDSFHPDTFVPDDDVGPSTVVSEELVDTSSDIADCSNDADRSTICDEETSTQMAESSNDRRYTPEPSESTRGSTFFKEFIFSPAVSIYVDYHGKNKINIEKNGAVFAVLTGIGQLNRTEFVLKEIVNRNGLLGVGRCVNVAVDEWLSDIRSNLPNVLASCGPISPIVQIGKGVMDLFWLPVAELRKEDGHVVKGIQKGVGSFGMSSAAGVVGMAQTVVGVIQMLAESVLREVQPTAPYLNERNRRAVAARAAAPTDLRHGMRLAYDIASDGYRQARDDLELAAQEDRASGQSSFRSVLNVAPKTFIRPLVVSTQIGYQLLGGLRAQLRPDVYQDERHKWKDEEVPGGSGQH
ncbi:ATG protein [Ancylostoma duodenale]|uniref:Autophagy-related protein 2 n=1 Tax=Ancylostoma duodenale TaxID=51022 RepID=A0A0C2H7L4_9BILA|nr:ATG protein [Ancylostoma duodenale]